VTSSLAVIWMPGTGECTRCRRLGVWDLSLL